MDVERGGEISPELARSSEEEAQMRGKMQFLARAFSGNFGVRVLPGQGWACSLPEEIQKIKLAEADLDQVDPKLLTPDRLSYPEKDLSTRSEEYIFGVLRHEIAELKFSSFRNLLKGQKMALSEGYKPQDFHALFNANNDCRVNNLEAAGSGTAQERLAGIYREDLGSFFEKIQEAPASLQYAGLVIGHWAQVFPGVGNIEELQTKITNPQVLEIYQNTAEALERASRAGQNAHYQILKDEIWPTYKELIEQYLEQEAQRQFNEDAQQKREAGGEGEAEGMPENFEELSDEQKQDYRQQAREKLTQAEEEFIEKTGSRSTETFEDDNGQLQIRFKEISQEEIEKADAEEQVMSEEDKKRIEQLKKEAQKRARSLKAQATALRERKLGLTEGEQQIYNEHRRRIERYIGALVREIERTFPPKEELGWVSGKPRGARIDPRRLAREVATEHGHFFKGREVEEVRTAAFSLGVDISGSMYQNDRIPPALETGIMAAEAFSRKNIPFEFWVYAGHPILLKDFDEDYKGIAKRKLIGILEQDQGHDFYNHTDTGYSLDWAAKRLERKSLQEKIPGCLTVITDGEPYPIAEHAGAEWELRSIVEKWQRLFPVIGIGVGPDIADNIENYFGREFAVAEPDNSQQARRYLEVLQNQFGRLRKIE